MIQYLQSLVLLSAQRLRGSSLQERAPPIEPFSNTNRGPRGIGAGDMLDSVIESEVVLEQIMLMEDKMKHQINKLIEAAKEKPQPSKAPNGQL